MKEKSKEIILAIAIAIVGIAYIGYNTLVVDLAQKDIMHFLATTMLVPAIILLAYGLLAGRNHKMIQTVPGILVVAAVVCAASIGSMYYMYDSGLIMNMIANTATGDGIVLDINDSITVGTIVQIALIYIVAACFGSAIGGKLTGLFKKIKN